MSEKNPRPSIRVGILSPCPPPYAGITRIVDNHLHFWPRDRVEAYLVPNHPPANPQPFDGATYLDLVQASARSWKGAGAYLNCLLRSPLTRPWVYRQFVLYNAGLSRLIQQQGLNVLYAHELWPAGASAVLQSQIHGIASVVVAYGETWHTTAQHRRWQRVEPYVLQGSSWIVSTSEHCLAGAIRSGARKDRASVIYAGIDLERFRPDLDGTAFRAEYGIPPDAIVISSLGLALRRKLETFLDALQHLEPGDNVHCLIGGVGDDSAYVEERARGIRGVKVQLLGFVPEKELPEFYAATDILVVSPRTLLECMGQSMKEAMACGRAVIGARIGGVPEAIRDDCSGLLFEPDNPVDLLHALKRLCADRGVRERMGNRGRKIAEEKFSAEVAARQTLEIFEVLLRVDPN